MNKVILIGGGSAAGKTLLSKSLSQAFPGQVSLLSFDAYYRPHPELCLEERAKVNYDDPRSVEEDLFIKDLKQLIANHEVQIPIYDFASHSRLTSVQTVIPHEYLIIDGIFALVFPEILSLADLKIFVTAPEDVRLQRRINRDVKERGRTPESVMKQFHATVQPSHLLYIEPSIRQADIIFENPKNHGLNQKEVELLIQRIKSL